MKPPVDRKLYLGPRLRVLRRELGLNQAQMAQELGISPSYLNHLERNQRPLSAQMLLRFVDVYDIDVRDFVAGASADGSDDLREMFSDPLVRDIGVPRDEVNDLAENYPSVVEAISRLYRALTDLRGLPAALDRLQGAVATGTALDGLSDLLHQHHNHFPELDQSAEALAATLPEEPADLYLALRERLQNAHGVQTRVVPETALSGVLRFYDFHRKRLLLSERLPASGRLMAVAFQLCLLAFEAPVRAVLARAAADARSARLMQIALVNYAAAALVMPYGRFLRAAQDSRHDIALLQARFGVSYEQAAHRLTTLGRPGERGVPFFMLKVDRAGTVSKRFAGEGVPLARFGGGCPRWNLYRAFQTPGQALAELVEMPDGERYFTLSRAIPPLARPGGAAQVIALGCAVRHMPRLADADALPPETATLIGPACHICERAGCPDRALPPVTRSLDVNPFERGVAPYPFQAV